MAQLNQRHAPYLLANKIDWDVFDEAFKGLYFANNGRPAKQIRRMVGLLILKHVRTCDGLILRVLSFPMSKTDMR